MKQAKDLSCDEIVDLVQSIQKYLYFDHDEQDRALWNPEKSWSGDEFEYIAQTLNKYGLVPKQPELAKAEKDPKRYALYNFDSHELVGSRIFDDPGLADDLADELENVIVVPVVIPRPIAPDAAAKQEPCECQQPGHFCSGVPGILAHVENCRLVVGGKVERCDHCQRYPSDQAAHDKLIELGMA